MNPRKLKGPTLLRFLFLFLFCRPCDSSLSVCFLFLFFFCHLASFRFFQEHLKLYFITVCSSSQLPHSQKHSLRFVASLSPRHHERVTKHLFSTWINSIYCLLARLGNCMRQTQSFLALGRWESVNVDPVMQSVWHILQIHEIGGTHCSLFLSSCLKPSLVPFSFSHGVGAEGVVSI